ncbi:MULTISPECIES: STAS domain-containing protein [Chromobacterium]|uniref:STAS domain-containing protein n=2 Tax=Chromobacterium TaxID=535 RepID=A0ABS3GM72_9NEIS|nr:MULTISPECIES: STAS domain-containing protein [Chromobacterium]AXT49118.1 anti-sigma factor antagonist [Chromobacterium rhizoryzae]MBK0414338.1 STAS domain-containing protein [Chromobacterium haemolyticum]MBO0415717.1 STAS domain-containing protein [Chromobacterium haemolyticum]MBO0498767.1 STAS domain-containing protein [Chromobacterium haemolyticum]OQS38516.1 hypothetical protein B0T40_06165 [Chromobacterium haemolyticum]
MTLHVEIGEGWAKASLSGELSIYTAEQLKSDLLPLLAHEAVSLSFAGVTEVDGCALQLLLAFGRQLRQLELLADNPLVSEAFQLLGVALAAPPAGGEDGLE